MASSDKICMQLRFTRASNRSEYVKVKEFWKFLNEKPDIQPYKIEDPTLNKKDKCEPPSTADTLPKSIWFDELKIFQQLSLDKTALAADDTCKFCGRESKLLNTKHLDFADSVAEPYEELNEQLKQYDERLNKNGNKSTSNVMKITSEPFCD